MKPTDQAVLDAIQTIRSAADDKPEVLDTLETVISKMGLRTVPEELFDHLREQVGKLRNKNNTDLQSVSLSAIASFVRDIENEQPMSKKDALELLSIIVINYTALTVYLADQTAAAPVLADLREDIVSLAKCLSVSIPELTGGAA